MFDRTKVLARVIGRNGWIFATFCIGLVLIPLGCLVLYTVTFPPIMTGIGLLMMLVGWVLATVGGHMLLSDYREALINQEVIDYMNSQPTS